MSFRDSRKEKKDQFFKEAKIEKGIIEEVNEAEKIITDAKIKYLHPSLDLYNYVFFGLLKWYTPVDEQLSFMSKLKDDKDLHECVTAQKNQGKSEFIRMIYNIQKLRNWWDKIDKK